ncbi:MAG TPA: dicarboxylate/amino acid:cation symporter [Tenericutes bacterium]|nr:dicarboxylate/amino acid:cation symporter [Mycoplasmatota bacterium]
MSFFKSKFYKAYRFPLILLLSIILGSIIGVIYGEDATILKPFGDIFLNLMYTVVVPLVFFSISSSIANMVNMKRLGKILKYMFIVFFITSAIAAVVMLVVLKLIDPVAGTKIVLENTDVEKLSLLDQIVKAITVNDFSDLLSRNHMLPLIVFSILFGASVSLIGKEGKFLGNILDSCSKVMMILINMIMYYAPIGLFAYFANLIGEFGPELLGSYARSMIIYYVVAIVYFFVLNYLYTYFAAKKEGVKLFFKNIFAPFITAVSTQSSLATLPTNLDAAEKMNIPKDIKDVVLPIGTTMHMEGSSLGAILKIVFLFGIFNKPFTGFDTYLSAILIAVGSAVVMSGIPGGGLIGEIFIVSLYDFPLSAFPIIATIGWLIDPPATALNATGDSSSAMIVARFVEGKNWLKRKSKS